MYVSSLQFMYSFVMASRINVLYFYENDEGTNLSQDALGICCINLFLQASEENV